MTTSEEAALSILLEWVASRSQESQRYGSTFPPVPLPSLCRRCLPRLQGFCGLHVLAKARVFPTRSGEHPHLCPQGTPSLSLSVSSFGSKPNHPSFQSFIPEMPDLFKLDCLDEPAYVGMLDTQHEGAQLTINAWHSLETAEN